LENHRCDNRKAGVDAEEKEELKHCNQNNDNIQAHYSWLVSVVHLHVVIKEPTKNVNHINIVPKLL